jgi:hypothetical protein
MKKTNSGITHILVLVAVMIAVAALIAIFLSMQKGGLSTFYPTTTETPAIEALPSPSPVSDSGDISTLEEEFNATVTGSVDTDIDSLNSEADSL